MAKAFYLQSTTQADLRFKIVGLDRETKVAQLQGPTGTKFSQRINEDDLAKFGYKVVAIDEAADA